MEHRSQTLQPNRSLPEPVTIPRDASNAALELPASTPTIQSTSSETRRQDGVVGANQSLDLTSLTIRSFVLVIIVASNSVPPSMNFSFILTNITRL
jgi:hypothetical protein